VGDVRVAAMWLLGSVALVLLDAPVATANLLLTRARGVRRCGLRTAVGGGLVIAPGGNYTEAFCWECSAGPPTRGRLSKPLTYVAPLILASPRLGRHRHQRDLLAFTFAFRWRTGILFGRGNRVARHQGCALNTSLKAGGRIGPDRRRSPSKTARCASCW